jgi:hypothetical protein
MTGFPALAATATERSIGRADASAWPPISIGSIRPRGLLRPLCSAGGYVNDGTRFS